MGAGIGLFGVLLCFAWLGLASLRRGVYHLCAVIGRVGGRASAGRGVGLFASCILGLDGGSGPVRSGRKSSHHSWLCFKGSFVLFFNSDWGWFCGLTEAHRIIPACRERRSLGRP
ncbi:uncharacterized protein B0H64DRAFT_411953 [Chaetomium fimeti]|uniref:Secreted protein n=1 Tax=Chaetomium fimeti TaxID=1854472 RepID=A0AAE0LMM4_9PEZI|nr:hypothetical protein B0H64DRAFT_411953 [Chaetomium fimeti]